MSNLAAEPCNEHPLDSEPESGVHPSLRSYSLQTLAIQALIACNHPTSPKHPVRLTQIRAYLDNYISRPAQDAALINLVKMGRLTLSRDTNTSHLTQADHDTALLLLGRFPRHIASLV